MTQSCQYVIQSPLQASPKKRPRKRDKIVIICNILETILLNPNRAPTRITQKCNLASSGNDYFENLTRLQFIVRAPQQFGPRRVGKRMIFVVTPKGLDWLHRAKMVLEAIDF